MKVKSKKTQENKEADYAVKVRCCKCGMIIADINLSEYKGPVWKCLLCKKCRSSSRVFVNPTLK